MSASKWWRSGPLHGLFSVSGIGAQPAFVELTIVRAYRDCKKSWVRHSIPFFSLSLEFTTEHIVDDGAKRGQTEGGFEQELDIYRPTQTGLTITASLHEDSND